MKEKKRFNLKERLLPYFQLTPGLLLFDVITSLIMFFVTTGISKLRDLVLGSAGKASISSGDIGFVFTRWQGYALITIMIMVILLFVAVDLNANTIYCSKLLNGEKASIFKCMLEGVKKLKEYAGIRGVIVIIYATLISPILGIGFSISLTRSFYIPNFIASVIIKNPGFLFGLLALLLFLLIVGIMFCFMIHGTLLENQSMKQAGAESRKIMKKHWKNFIFEIIRFILLYWAAFAVIIIALYVIPQIILGLIPMNETLSNYFDVFLNLFGITVAFCMQTLVSAFLIMKTIILYRTYQTNGEWQYKKPEKTRKGLVIATAVAVVLIIALVSIPITYYYNDLFAPVEPAKIIAHRAGGSEAPENTVKGINTAYKLGAYGSEIDIQRTSDGYYVVNHDNDFERVAGVNKKPSEMTLAEVKKLKVDGEPIATLEEMLDASKDHVILFVELKGETADNKMADDAVRIIKEKGMEEQAVLISLKYDILEYIEQKYPEMDTGYLAFFSFGKTEDMPFDYLALEEEISTESTIEAIHEQNKKIMVWTVNDNDNIKKFLDSGADAIITDEVKLSKAISDELKKRSRQDVFNDYIDNASE